ncbi:MAG: hypothetical protein E7311_05260 [Clostridiales bacterium]|nr:hypothetical protein [Clostridiales bacterium]
MNKKWQDFINWATVEGFKIGYTNNFEYNLLGAKSLEEEIIFFNEEKGLILYATSFRGVVNSASLYGEFHSESYPELAFQFRTSEWKDDGTFIFELDATSMQWLLRMISDQYVFSKKWKHKKFLWFVNYVETKEEYDPEQINNKKLMFAAPEVRRIIGVA